MAVTAAFVFMVIGYFRRHFLQLVAGKSGMLYFEDFPFCFQKKQIDLSYTAVCISICFVCCISMELVCPGDVKLLITVTTNWSNIFLFVQRVYLWIQLCALLCSEGDIFSLQRCIKDQNFSGFCMIKKFWSQHLYFSGLWIYHRFMKSKLLCSEVRVMWKAIAMKLFCLQREQTLFVSIGLVYMFYIVLMQMSPLFQDFQRGLECLLIHICKIKFLKLPRSLKTENCRFVSLSVPWRML